VKIISEYNSAIMAKEPRAAAPRNRAPYMRLRRARQQGMQRCLDSLHCCVLQRLKGYKSCSHDEGKKPWQIEEERWTKEEEAGDESG